MFEYEKEPQEDRKSELSAAEPQLYNITVAVHNW